MRTLAKLASLALALAACTKAASKPPELTTDPQTLSWRSTAPLADQAIQQLAEQTAQSARSRHAWGEPSAVRAADGAPGDGKAKFVFGQKKLLVGEYEAEPGKFQQVDKHDDALMAYSEALAIAQTLSRLARSASASFDLQLGDQRGQVTASGYDPGTQKLLKDLQARAGAPADAEALEQERARIDAKYRGRK